MVLWYVKIKHILIVIPPLSVRAFLIKFNKLKKALIKSHSNYAGLPYIYQRLIRCGNVVLSITPEKHKGYVYYHCTQYNGKHEANGYEKKTITNQLGKVFKNLQMPKEVF